MFQTLPPQQQRNLAVLFGTGLVFWTSLASLLPVLSLYIKDTGASDFQVGIVMGAFAIGLLVFRPWVGRLADQRDRKLVLYIGFAAAILAPFGYILTQNIILLVLVRIFHGLSIAAFTTGFSALVADMSPPQYRGEIIGYMTLVNPMGVAIGPALGGFLQAWAGYVPLFLFSAGLGLLGLLGVQQLRIPPGDRPLHAPIAESTNFWQLILSPRLRIPALVLGLVGIAFGAITIFVPLLIKDSGVALNPGLFYTAAAIASFTSRLVVGRPSDRYGRGRFITGGLAIYTIALVMLWQAHSAPGLLLAGFLEGAGAGVIIPVIVALAADRSEAQERGRVFSLVLAGFDLGMAIAGPIFGYFALSLGYQGVFGVTASLTFLALILFVILNSKTLAYSLKFSLGSGQDVYALPKSF